jgi:hypothetical protein
MYKFKAELNEVNFFWWTKRMFEDLTWAGLPLASKAVLPVLAAGVSRKGKTKGWTWPSEMTIAIEAGISPKTVREGTKALETLWDGFKIARYITNRGRSAKKYHLSLPSANVKGKSFPFHGYIIESGQWQHLIPTAKALYPVMRHFGYFDYFEYDPDDGGADFEFGKREYDFCIAEEDYLAEFSGIHLKSIEPALRSLEKNWLIEPADIMTDDGCGGWKVFLKSKDGWYHNRDALNKKAFDLYGYPGK